MNTKLLITLSVWVLSCAVFSPPAYSNSNLAAGHYVEAGKKYFNEKDFDRAIVQFQKALLADPKNEDALLFLRLMGYGQDAVEQDRRQREQETQPVVAPDKKRTPVEKISPKKEKALEKVRKESRRNKQKSLTQFQQDQQVKEEAVLAEFKAKQLQQEKKALEQYRNEIARGASPEHAARVFELQEPILLDVPELVAPLAVEQKSAIQPVTAFEMQKEGSVDLRPQPEESVSESAKPKTAKEERIAKSAKSKTAKNVSKSAKPKTAKEEGVSKSTKPKTKKELQQEARKAKKEAALKKKEETRQRKEQARQKKLEAKEARQSAKAKKTKESVPSKKSAKTQKDIKSGVLEHKDEKLDLKAGDKVDYQESLKAVARQTAQETEQPVKAKSSSIKGALTMSEDPDDRKLSAEIQELIKKTKERAVEPADIMDEDQAAQQQLAAAKQRLDEAGQREQLIAAKYADAVAPKDESEKALLEKLRAKTAQQEKYLLSQLRAQAARDEKALLAQLAEDRRSQEDQALTQVADEPEPIPDADLSEDMMHIEGAPESASVRRPNETGTAKSSLSQKKAQIAARRGEVRQETDKFTDLQARMKALEDELYSKKYDFKDKQLEYDKKLQDLEEEFGNYRYEKSKTEEELKDNLKTLKDALQQKIAELNAAEEKLIFAEYHLKSKEARGPSVSPEMDQLKNTLSELETRLSEVGSDVDSAGGAVRLDPNNLPPAKTKEEEIYRRWIQRHDRLVNKLKDKLLWARDRMEYFGEYDVKLSDEKIAVLKKEIAQLKIQLKEKDAFPAAGPADMKAEDYALMEDRLKDAQERLDMVEKILREKDDQIKELEDQLNGVLGSFE